MVSLRVTLSHPIWTDKPQPLLLCLGSVTVGANSCGSVGEDSTLNTQQSAQISVLFSTGLQAKKMLEAKKFRTSPQARKMLRERASRSHAESLNKAQKSMGTLFSKAEEEGRMHWDS